MNLVENKKSNKCTFFLQVFTILFSFFLLSACSFSQSQKHHPLSNRHSNQPRHYSSDFLTKGNLKLPISIPEGEFFKVAGWISNKQIIYITNHEQNSNLYSYNLTSGSSELLYKSNDPIVTAVVSPTKKYILIQSSPSTYEGNITVINTNGTIKWQKTIASFELEYEWNPYNESEILVSKFNEDWSFKVFKLNVKEKNLTALSLSQPFVGWVDNQHIAFINWDQNNPALSDSNY